LRLRKREREREGERERGRVRERETQPVADAEDAEGVLSSASVYLQASRYLDSHTSLYVCMYVPKNAYSDVCVIGVRILTSIKIPGSQPQYERESKRESEGE
jgi:hypothetical protein